MTVTAASFREAFPPFADESAFPDAEINFWINLGLKLHDACRYGDLLDDSLLMFVAHNLTLEFNSRKAACTGNNPGAVEGPITSAAVDKVSYSRNPGVAMDPKNGHWNLSTYGLRWKWLQNLVGAGPVQIGVPAVGDGSIGAWPGPMPTFW